MENFVELYKEETKELLNDIQDTLLELESRPTDRDLIDRVFRAMHNMKGNSAMFGFDNISAFTHDIETVYDKVREGELSVTPELINLTLEACDQINLMLFKPDTDDKQKEKNNSILKRFSQLLPEKKEPEHLTDKNIRADERDTKTNSNDKKITYLIQFIPNEDIFLSGTNPLLLLKELLELGDGSVIAHQDKIPDFEKMNPEKCYLYWTIILTTSADVRAIQDVFIFVEDESEIKIEAIDVNGNFSPQDIEAIKKPLMVENGLPFEKICQIFADKQKEQMAISGQEIAEKEDRKIKEKKPDEPATGLRVVSEQKTTIRVPSDKLDSLINLVGELVTVQANLMQTALKNGDSRYLAVAEELERLTTGLCDITTEIRLVPVGSLFSKYRRLVRDLARAQKKEINLIFEGGEIELDKTIIDRLGDPLVHLIRNSIDHGIEPPEVREKKGKPRKGTIRIAAKQIGAQVWIQVCDDGKGIDPDKIYSQAVEKSIVSANKSLNASEILQLIFLPGLSTAKKVSDISGRGVGMDVVKRRVEELRGTVTVESEVGKGTTITLRLPLTLGIIDGLVIKVGAERFVLPISVVQDCQEFHPVRETQFKHREIIEINGDVIPFIRLREYFSLGEKHPKREHLIITSVNDKKLGIVVDEIEREHQIVIKPLGKLYRNIEEISGATILGEGSLALILDVAKLIEAAEREEFASVQNF